MEKTIESKAEAEARRRSEARAARILGIIIGSFIVISIGGMMVFDMYGEKMAGAHHAPTDAADR